MQKPQDLQLKQIVTPLLRWYRENKRDLPWRQNRDPYRIWISEIMLQQTRVEAVKEYYRRFLDELPDVEALAAVDEERLMKLWEGLGYYTRARNLQKAAQQICRDHDGKFPQTFDEIRSLPGIGEYTAGAISSIAFELQTPAVDGNVLRVLARLQEDPRDIADAKLKKEKTRILQEIYPEAGDCGDFTQSLMELGAIVCLPNGAPLCDRCPFQDLCSAHHHGTEQQLPVKTKKTKRKKEKKTVLLLQQSTQNGRLLAIRKRPADGLLAGLWELPSIDGHLTAEDLMRTLNSETMPESFGKKKHIFTHIEWDMRAYLVKLPPEKNEAAALCMEREFGEGLVWVSKGDLDCEYSLPTAFRTFVKQWMECRAAGMPEGNPQLKNSGF